MPPPFPDADLRPIRAVDLARIGRWLDEPHVAPWWDPEIPRPIAPEDVLLQFGEFLVPSPDHGFIAVVDGRDVGVISCYWLSEHLDHPAHLVAKVPEGAIAVDLFLGEPDLRGRRIATGMIMAAIRFMTGRAWNQPCS